MKAVICPVCGGSGQLPVSVAWATDAAAPTKTCHGCGGTGWVSVSE